MRTLARLLPLLLAACTLANLLAAVCPAALIAEFKKDWPHNRTINLVFHSRATPPYAP